MCTRFSMFATNSVFYRVNWLQSIVSFRRQSCFMHFPFAQTSWRFRTVSVSVNWTCEVRLCDFCIRCRFSFHARVAFLLLRLFVLVTSLLNNLFNESSAQRATLPFEINERPERIPYLYCRIAQLNVLYCGHSFDFGHEWNWNRILRKKDREHFVRSVFVRRWRIHSFCELLASFCLRSLKSHQSINGEQNVKLTWKM